MRTIVDLPEKQLNALSSLCQKQRISRAEAVRRAVDRLISENNEKNPDFAFGIWKHKTLSSRKSVDVIRDEWSTE